ncbi:MAG: M20/M25/M40 family metallo-hydrolase, partial [Candidatus Bathyarchaeia archaeon]
RVGSRYWPGQTSQGFFDTVKKWLAKLQADDSTILTEVEVYLDDGNTPIETKPDEAVVKVLQKSIKQTLSREPKLVGNVYSCESPFYQRAGMQCAWCGPGVIGPDFSTPKEHIKVSELTDACKVYVATIINACA